MSKINIYLPATNWSAATRRTLQVGGNGGVTAILPGDVRVGVADLTAPFEVPLDLRRIAFEGVTGQHVDVTITDYSGDISDASKRGNASSGSINFVDVVDSNLPQKPVLLYAE